MESKAPFAKYACDDCRSRKIRCSREAPVCTQCRVDARDCIYSRSGVIRRHRKRLKKAKDTSPVQRNIGADEPDSESDGSKAADLQTQLDYDITKTQRDLQQLGESDDDAHGTLLSLSAEYSSFWQGPSLRDMARELGLEEKKLLSFNEDEARSFTDVYLCVVKKGGPLLTPTPSDVLYNVFRRPGLIQEKAHVVLVYGILLTEACLDSSFDKRVVTKLRWNLRIALDDSKLLLEPSDINIQALMILAIHVQELTTPSLCWMLLSNAGRMLQVLGVNPRNLDEESRDRRLHLFWTMNAIDKNMALVFGRPPTFHDSFARNVPLMPLQKLLEYQPHITSPGPDSSGPAFLSMFGAHIMRQMHESSVVVSGIWSYLFENRSKFDEAQAKLEAWYRQASSMLNACLLAEQPFFDKGAVEAMKLGIKNIEFHYYYLRVLLLRSKSSLKDQCISASRKALQTLADLVSDSADVFNGVVWLLLFCPFTPFFVLFGEILSSGNCQSSLESLKAMEIMCDFLDQMRSRHPQAAKLHTIATTLVKHARTTVMKQRIIPVKKKRSRRASNLETLAAQNLGQDISASPSEHTDYTASPSLGGLNPGQASTQPLQDLFNDPSVQSLSLDMNLWMPNPQSFDGTQAVQNGYGGLLDAKISEEDPYGFLADSTFDWLSWSSNPGDMLGPMY